MRREETWGSHQVMSQVATGVDEGTGTGLPALEGNRSMLLTHWKLGSEGCVYTHTLSWDLRGVYVHTHWKLGSEGIYVNIYSKLGSEGGVCTLTGSWALRGCMCTYTQLHSRDQHNSAKQLHSNKSVITSRCPGWMTNACLVPGSCFPPKSADRGHSHPSGISFLTHRYSWTI